MRHPAKFSDPILDALAPIVSGLPGPILDPFAGTGRIHELGRDDTIGVEIEPEWAALHERTEVGNALRLRFGDGEIGSIVTSPTYGNRMADNYDGRDGTTRYTYRLDLGRPLSPDNSGGLQWGEKYREFHRRAWREAFRVIRPEGRLVLNVSDHVRKGAVVPVTLWHVETVLAIGFESTPGGWLSIETKRNGNGANRDARVPYESIIVFEKPAATS